MIAVEENKLTKEMKNIIKEFTTKRTKEIELVLASTLREQTEMKNGKLAWKTKIETHIQSIQENLNKVENEVLFTLDKFEKKFNLDGIENTGVIDDSDWYLFKEELKKIFKKRKLS